MLLKNNTVDIENFFRAVGTRILPHNNKRCVAPPGKLIEGVGSRPIVVASLMRSGTHVLIDTILNNFCEYKKRPLYLDLDQYLKKGYDLSKLSKINSMVVKTHYPQDNIESANCREIQNLFKRSHVLMPIRDSQQVFNSLSQFMNREQISMEEFVVGKDRFDSFWSGFDVLRMPFAEMIDKKMGEHSIQKIADYIDQPCPSNLILPMEKHRVFRNLSTKFKTRVFGSGARIINTTVSFARTK